MQRTALALTLTLGAFSAAASVAADDSLPRIDSQATDLTTQLRQLDLGDRFRLVAPQLPAGSVELERVRVFSPDARLVLQTEQGSVVRPLPETIYYRGWTDDPSGGLVTLSLRANGELRGLVTRAGGFDFLVGGASFGVPVGLEVRPARLDGVGGGFQCGNADLPEISFERAVDSLLESFSRPGPEVSSLAGASYTARIAVETDQEYLGLFGGDTTAATDYTGDLFNYASGIYDSEVDTTLLVSHLSLWTSTDPWTQSSTACMLYQVGRYWNDNNSGISRTITHFLSGRNVNAGVAWVGVLCNGAFNVDHMGACPSLSPQTDNYGGAYGVTAGIDANFDPDNPSPVWDIVATAHEVGHNFNSPHTHCYANLGGNASPVDTCNAGQCGQTGCHCGATSLPCANPGTGCGTIMSYCHLLSPGLSNITLTFGLGHPFGIAPGRVPSRMNDHVVARAGSNPGCLDFIAVNEIFADGFESGDTTAW